MDGVDLPTVIGVAVLAVVAAIAIYASTLD